MYGIIMRNGRFTFIIGAKKKGGKIKRAADTIEVNGIKLRKRCAFKTI